MKKKKYWIAGALAVYACLCVAVVAGWIGSPAEETAPSGTSEAVQEVTVPEEKPFPASDRDFSVVENELEYRGGSQAGIYVRSEDVLVDENDKISILSRYALPALERMSEEDQQELMGELQVLKKIEVLGIDTDVFYTPEFNWKQIYNESLTTVEDALNFEEVVEFNGTSASELNAFMQGKSGVTILVTQPQINLDETIKVPSNVVLDGQGALVTGENNVQYAFLLDGVENVGIHDFHLNRGFQYGIYVVQSSKVLLANNEIAEAVYKAVCVMGENTYINMVGNSIHDNGNGAIFMDGNISRCILQENDVYQNRGTRNLTAGIVLSSMPTENLYDAYNPFLDEHLYDLTEAPHDNVLRDNIVQGNYSSGIYSDGGYMNYIIGNTIEENEKEGMCLDYGTFGTYVSANTIQGNGNRDRQTDEDLEADFVLEAGRLEDGSSPLKLPGVSIDNSAYNIVSDNLIRENAGSGVKVVRSGYRNIVLENLIVDNSKGTNDNYHGFGVELGYASTPDQPVKGLDFTPSYENIVARNIVSGAHYSGIFLAQDSYCNDLIDNVIMGATDFSIENHSTYFNSGVGNNYNLPTLDFPLPTE